MRTPSCVLMDTRSDIMAAWLEDVKDSIRYSQNFVTNPDLVSALLDKSSIGREDTVYEIGSGLGMITAKLARRCKQVVAVETDRRLYERLKGKFGYVDNVMLICGDFLAQALPSEPYKVFSNIPFNITADIVRKLVESENPPLDAYLFVQKEAAKKLSGSPFGAQETQFSVLTKPRFEYRVIHKLARTDFQPPPAVDVVLLQITRRSEPLIDTEQWAAYRDFIVYAFNAKKPTLKQGLGPVFTHHQFKQLAKDLRFDLRSIPSELGFEQWLGLFRYFCVGVIEEKQQLVWGTEAERRRQQQRLQKVHRTRTARDWQRRAGEA
jgi:16S rRNA A1518/A1519 N6-dimethyltransferase RsmA/KsgA/DIM1 with predicted DNA glycosylase/AP lyase activity